MSLIKKINGSSVNYYLQDCAGGAGGTPGPSGSNQYSGRYGQNGGSTYALIDNNSEKCVIVAGAGGGSRNGNGGPGGAAYNDELPITINTSVSTFYYLLQDTTYTGYMTPLYNPSSISITANTAYDRYIKINDNSKPTSGLFTI